MALPGGGCCGFRFSQVGMDDGMMRWGWMMVALFGFCFFLFFSAWVLLMKKLLILFLGGEIHSWSTLKEIIYDMKLI